ncbi:MAG: trehalose-phosphatase, partial [Pigmentiphaga sp.]
MPRLPALDSAALFLDLDGTLVPLAPRPEHVNLPDSTLHLLQGLQGACSGALALVSGRDRNSLLP